MRLLRLAAACLATGFNLELALRNLWAAIGTGVAMIAVTEWPAIAALAAKPAKVEEEACLSGPACGLCATRRWHRLGIGPLPGGHWGRILGSGRRNAGNRPAERSN